MTVNGTSSHIRKTPQSRPWSKLYPFIMHGEDLKKYMITFTLGYTCANLETYDNFVSGIYLFENLEKYDNFSSGVYFFFANLDNI